MTSKIDAESPTPPRSVVGRSHCQDDTARLDKLAAYLSDPTKNISGPFGEDTSWQFGFNGGAAYIIEGAGGTLREAIDTLPDVYLPTRPEGAREIEN